MKTSDIWAGVGSVAACLLFFCIGFFGREILDPAPKISARVEMWHFSSQISLGDSAAKVERVFNAAKYTSLELQKREPSFWVVNTPGEIAANWLLYIELQNSQVKALRFRTPDDMRFRSNEKFVPLDRVEKGWESPREDLWELR